MTKPLLVSNFRCLLVGGIVASAEESGSCWQQKDYKFFSPGVDWDNVDWDSAPAIQVRGMQEAVPCHP